jgi:hypothetical protein
MLRLAACPQQAFSFLLTRQIRPFAFLLPPSMSELWSELDLPNQFSLESALGAPLED